MAAQGNAYTPSAMSSVNLVSLLSVKRSHAVAFATPGSAVSINTLTSSASATTSNTSILPTNSSKTLAVGSTGNDRVYSPFWTPSVMELSQRLWLPTAIDSRVSAWSSWNGCSRDTTRNSWFSTTLTEAISGMKPMNSAMTYSPSLLSSWLATTEGGPQQIASDAAAKPAKKAKIITKKQTPEKPNAAKARKIRVYPSVSQRALLLKWFGTARWTYNQCLEAIKENRAQKTKKDLRALLVNNDNYAMVNQWVLDTPYEVRDAAMVDLLNAFTSNFAKKAKSKNHHFTMRFRSKKSPQEAIMIRGKCYKNQVFYPKFFGKQPLRAAERLPDQVDYDCKLVRTRLGHYYLVIPMPLAIASDNQARIDDRVIALDPGVRTFHTAYDPTGCVIEFGKGDIGRITRLCAHMDKLQSRIDSDKTLRHKARYRMRRAWRKMHWRIRNLIDECHKKIVKFLVSNYSVILLPSFKTQQMTRKKTQNRQRALTPKSARAMVTWSHYRFKQRLLFKRQEYPWCNVVVCSEAYTSKTCGRCGKLNHTLERAKVFECPSCGLEGDRDALAARNILLKNASLFGFMARETLGLTPSLGSAWA